MKGLFTRFAPVLAGSTTAATCSYYITKSGAPPQPVLFLFVPVSAAAVAATFFEPPLLPFILASAAGYEVAKRVSKD